jgi:hypothetical protein
MADVKYQLIQSANDLRAQADRERLAMSKVQKQRDQLKQNSSSNHTFGVAASGTEDAVNRLDRQIKDMSKDIDRLEFQARDMDKQARSI